MLASYCWLRRRTQLASRPAAALCCWLLLLAAGRLAEQTAASKRPTSTTTTIIDDNNSNDNNSNISARSSQQESRETLTESEATGQWRCHRVNPIFGAVLLKTSCNPNWSVDTPAATQVKHSCEYVAENPDQTFSHQTAGSRATKNFDSKGKSDNTSSSNSTLHATMQLDPVGTMLPITDLTSGITYANSFCLRCNQLSARPKLIYWSPLLECNYNLDSDDRNTLYDLISISKGSALEYSSKSNKWTIRPQAANTASANGQQQANATPSSSALNFERACSITPTIPEVAEHIVRFCRPENAGARSAAPAPMGASANQASMSNIGGSPLASDQTETSLAARSRGESSLSAPDGIALSGSFSVLMDLYSSSQGDEQVGAIHQCPDAQNQVYDPFFLTCRDVICGLNQHYVDGKCISSSKEHADSLRGGLVDKFKPAMVYVTSACLIVSSLSLALYLLLHWLSMLDLRSLLADMAAAQLRAFDEAASGEGADASRNSNNIKRQSGGSETSLASSIVQQQQQQERLTARSQSLSSRGVACLAGSLLAAYLLFLLGHNGNVWFEQASVGCMAIAVGTYYCFLVAFSWMFLLSYDIWRTLRLATCQLRGPVLHAQSGRFIVYSLLALLSSGLIVGASILIDQAPLTCSSLLQQLQQQQQQQAPTSNSSSLQIANQSSAGSAVSEAGAFVCSGSSSASSGAASNNDTTNQDAFANNTHNSNTNSNSTTLAVLPAPDLIDHPARFGYLTTSNAKSRNCTLLQVELEHFVNTYRPRFGQRPGSCWFSNRRALGLFFGLPVTLIMMLNLLFFLHSSFMVIRTSSRSSRHFRLYGRLSTIMGLTWLTGLIASLVDQSDALWYLFTVLNTLQGMFIFIAFGCKRSKLTNLKILIEYARFTIHRVIAKRFKPAKEASNKPQQQPPPTTATTSINKSDHH